MAGFARGATVEDVREFASGRRITGSRGAAMRFKGMMRSKMPESITVDTTARHKSYPGLTPQGGGRVLIIWGG